MSAASHHRHRHRGRRRPRRARVRHAGPPQRRARRRRAVGARPASATRPPRSTARAVDEHADVARRRAGRRAGRSRQRLDARRREADRRCPGSPPDPEAIGVSRRQFFNRATVTLMGAGIGALRRRRLRRLPVADGERRLRSARSTSASSTTSSGHHRPGSGFFYAPAARAWITALPGRRPAQGRGGVPRQPSSPACSSGIVALYQKCPHLGCRVPSASPASGSSARATARSTTRSARRRPARRRAAWTASPSRSAGSGDVTIDTGTVVPGPADRHQHHRPGGRGPALHHRRREALMTCVPGHAAVRRIATSSIASDRAHCVDRWSAGTSALSTPRSTPARRARSSAPRSSWRANRKPYYDDEELEGKRLERVQLVGVLLLVVIVDRPAALLGARADPPGRGHGAGRRRASPAGARSCSRRRPNGGFNCAGCHGGMKATGGIAPYTVTDPRTGEVTRGQLVSPRR